MWRFDGTAWQQVGAEWNLPEAPVAQLGFDRDGILWVLIGVRDDEVPKELYFLAPGSRQFTRAATNLRVVTFTWDADNRVLTSREGGLPELGSLVEMKNPPQAYPILRRGTEQFLDRANSIWQISSKTDVLRHTAGEPLAQTVAKMSLANSEAYDIYPNSLVWLVDREGSIWFGAESGVHRLSYSPLVRQVLPKLPAPWFMLAPDDGGTVWISAADGTGTSALYRVAGGEIDRQLPIAGVSSFAYRAPDKTYWFGGEGGLWHMVDGRLVKVDLPPEMADRSRFLVTMTDDGSSGFWVSFGGAGLYRLRDGVWTKYPGQRNAPASDRTVCPRSGVVIAFTDGSRRVWLGCTRNRLAVLEGEREQSFGPGEGVQVGNVSAIHGKGPEVWIGGEFGLQRFADGRFRTIRALDTEALRGVSGIVETANGDLWLNGLGGIVHIGHEEITKALNDPGHRVSSERFDRRAGLPGLPSQLQKMPTAVEGTDGRLWFTVNNGVVWLDPTRPIRKPQPPPVSIQSVSANNEHYALDQPLRFPAGTSNVQISYAAVSLLHPESTRFRYRVREIDRDWQEAATATSVSYRSLPPGVYHFEVGASDADARWSDKTASLEFAVLPAFYQTQWFRALCAVLYLLLAWAVYRLRIRSLHRQFEMTLEARVGERTRIVRDLHDTLLQSSHGLLLRFQTATDLLPGRPAEARQVLAGAIDLAAEAITEGRDAVQGLRTAATETNDLADALRALGENLANEGGGGVALRVEVQGTTRALHPIVRDEAFRIGGEALRNAFRHAAAQQIEVELRYDERQLRIRVRDDGKGIDPQVLRAQGRAGHFGLPGMRERARLVGGKLTVWSGTDAGTEVELTIPAARAYLGPSPKRSWLAKNVLGRREAGDSGAPPA